MIRRGSMVRIHPDPPGSGIGDLRSRGSARSHRGAVAQLGERLLCKQEVVGSIPSSSTIQPPSPPPRVVGGDNARYGPERSGRSDPSGALRSGFSTGIGCSLTIGKKQTSARRSWVVRWVRLYRPVLASEFGRDGDRKRPCIAKATFRKGRRVGSVMGSSD